MVGDAPMGKVAQLWSRLMDGEAVTPEEVNGPATGQVHHLRTDGPKTSHGTGFLDVLECDICWGRAEPLLRRRLSSLIRDEARQAVDVRGTLLSMLDAYD